MKSITNTVIAILGIIAVTGCAAVSRRSENQSDHIVLSNNVAELIVSPVIGRISSYRLKTGNNVLWKGQKWSPEDQKTAKKHWNNYGGCRLWGLPEGKPRLMTLGRWAPADIYIDGLPWQVTKRNNLRIVMQSLVSPETGLRATRDITLSASGSEVIIHDTLTRCLNIECPVHIWSIAQVKIPRYVLLNTRKWRHWKYRLMTGRDKMRRQNKVKEYSTGSVLYCKPLDKGCSKLGSCGDWLAAVYDNTVFVNYTTLYPKAFYIDGLNCEVYVEPGKMLEMETLSPLKMLRPGESLKSTTVWKLLPINSKNSTENIIRMIDAGH